MAKKKSAVVPLDDCLVVSPARAFDVLGVGETFGHKLLNAGVLERIYIGGESRVKVESIKRVARDGVPPEALPPKKSSKTALSTEEVEKPTPRPMP